MALRCLPRVRPCATSSRCSRRVRLEPLHRSLATVELCPSPTCACAETPDLEIDRKKPLKNTISPHRCQLVVHTGRTDWAKRIEDDEQKPNLAKALKALLGPKGPFYDATSNSVMVTNSSAEPPGTVSVFPSGRSYKLEDYEGVESDFIRTVLVPQSEAGEPSGSWTSNEKNTRRYVNPVVMICSHGTRDSRCGVLGPLLRDEFVAKAQHLAAFPLDLEVQLISHIGGHVFAGNVIIYIPDSFSSHDLSGKVIWYGRVEPKHVEGILAETIEKGNIIQELYRGGLNESGNPIQL